MLFQEYFTVKLTNFGKNHLGAYSGASTMQQIMDNIVYTNHSSIEMLGEKDRAFLEESK